MLKVGLKYISDNKFANLKGDELKEAIKEEALYRVKIGENKISTSSVTIDEIFMEYLSKKSKKIKMIEIQRSKGYSTRKSITINKLEKVIKFIKSIDKDVIIMLDNCYGEFVENIRRRIKFI